MSSEKSVETCISIDPDVIVCAGQSEFIGEVFIGRGTIIHPSVRIIAEAGPIFIGDENIIEEQCVIVNRFPPNVDKDRMNQVVMLIGSQNIFEVGSYCEALKIGDNNILESKARIGRGIALTNGCIIGAKCSLTTTEIVPENTWIFGASIQRMVMPDRPKFPTKERDLLKTVLPSFNNLKR